MSSGTRPRVRSQVTFGDIPEMSMDVKKTSHGKHHREDEGELRREGGGRDGEERRSREGRRQREERETHSHHGSHHGGRSHHSSEIRRQESVRERPRREGSQRVSRHSQEEESLVSGLKEASISGYQDSESITAQTHDSKSGNKKKFASKMRSIVSAVKTAQRLERSLHRATDATFVPKYASEDIIRSGHLDYNTLFASNEQQTGELTVNLINAPNNSTLQCGCENINCPFCNLMMSIGNTEIQ